MFNYKSTEKFDIGSGHNKIEYDIFAINDVLRDLAYKVISDFDKARADFTKALELNPDDEIAKEYLGELNKA